MFDCLAASSFRQIASPAIRRNSPLNGDNKRNCASLLICASSQKPQNQQLVTLQSKLDTLLDSVKWDDKGLAVAIAQNVDTGAILMQGFANREALATTISSRKATFYSRSRRSLWTKGETSLNFIDIHDIFLDCDRDSILYLGKPHGPTCHTGSETCYFSSVNDFLKQSEVEENRLVLTTLYSLESIISQRKSEIGGVENGKPSWTKRLLTNPKLLCSKIREEADELCCTVEENEDKSRAASEMADVLYHAMVLLAIKDVKIDYVLQVLRVRFPIYYESANDALKQFEVKENRLALTTLYSLESIISQRKANLGETEDGDPFCIKRLLTDTKLLCSKIREEADELCQSLEQNEDELQVASEMADVLYHTMVLLAVKDVKIEDVLQVLRHRFSQSGIEEKNSRKSHGQG